MPSLLLHTQKISELEQDDNVTRLILTDHWINKHTFNDINTLGQLYVHVVSLNLSAVGLLKAEHNLIVSIATTFPEITDLVLNSEIESAAHMMKFIALSFKFLKSTAFSQPAELPTPSFSYLNPGSWSLPFWPAASSNKIDIPHHHDTLRDLFDVSNISEGRSNILSDWNRLGTGSLQLNGQSISTILHTQLNGEYFLTREALKGFFLQHLLFKLPTAQQKDALDFVMKTLHQGGLQNPVTASVYQYCASKDFLPQPADAKNMVNGIPGQNRILQFNATNTGFTVHELLIQNRLVYPISSGDKAGALLLPDKEFKFVFKAEAILEVCWNGCSSQPKVYINNVGITFGSASAKELFDRRWFYQEWIDNISYYTGLNRITEPVQCSM